MVDEKRKNFVPLTFDNAKMWDRIVHIFKTQYDKKIICNLWKIIKIDKEDPEALRTIQTDNCNFYLMPEVWWWNICIDRRPRYKRILDRLLWLKIYPDQSF